MSLSPNEKYPGATEADPNYKDSKFKDNNPSTTNNGSPLKALDRNEQLALQEAMMNAAGFDYNGVVDTPQNSQMFNAYKAALSNGANLLSNHNFLIASPDDSQPAPSATPTSYPPGFQIFSGVFANETTGILNLTYIDGRVSFSGGDFYMAVPNTGALENITEFVASVADFDGKPRTRGVSYALVGDEYRVTVGVDALEDESANETLLGSVKFEQGSVATRHEVGRTAKEEAFYSAEGISGLLVQRSVKVGDYISEDTDAITPLGSERVYPLLGSIEGTISQINLIATPPELTTDNGTVALGDIKYYHPSHTDIKAAWAVADYDINSQTGTDSTLMMQAAIDAGKPVYWSGGDYMITSQIVGDNSSAGPRWFGDGRVQTRVFCNGSYVAIAQTNLQGKVRIGGTPYIIAPTQIDDIGFYGVNKEGVGLKVGQDGSFIGILNWNRVDVSGFGLCADIYNVFGSSLNSVRFVSGRRGVQIQPLDTPGADDGYITTFQWSDCLIGYHEGFGLSVNLPLGSRNFSWENTFIEGNNTIYDQSEGMCSFYNVKLSADNCYFEKAPQVPAFYCYGTASIDLVDPNFSNTGGVEWEDTFFFSSKRGSYVDGGDQTFSGPLTSNQSFYLEKVPFTKSHRLYTEAGGQTVNAVDTFSIKGYYSNQGLTLRKATTSECSELTRTKVFNKTIGSVTIAANSSVKLINNQAGTADGSRTGGMPKLTGVSGSDQVVLTYTSANTASDNFWGVLAYNPTSSPIVLDGATLLVYQVQHNPSTEIII